MTGSMNSLQALPARLIVLKHVPFEGPAAIADWAFSRGIPVEIVNLFAPHQLPDLSGSDWLVVMGGPMNVDEEQLYGFLAAEKMYLRDAIEQGRTVIGICLGAQLIARSLGAKVFPNREREIGWLPIELAESAKAHSPFSEFPSSVEVFHWHGDTFDLPPGAKLMASSAACSNQAFMVGKRAIGLQFHIETTPDSAAELLNCCSDDLSKPGRFVQTAQEIAGTPEKFRRINKLLFDLLDRLAC